MSNKNQAIIVKKVKKGGHGFHGGSWKVAFADFAVAMMAFFLVLWLSETATDKQKQYIAGYFQDPGGAIIGPGGADKAVIEMQAPEGELIKPSIEGEPDKGQSVINEDDIEQLAAEKDQQRLEELREKLIDLVNNSPDLSATKDQIHVDIVPEGIRVQIFDRENRPMFAGGSARLQPFTRNILNRLAQVIKKVPNKVSLTGHTDRIPYTGRPGYSNWELSADRANAARRQLVKGGLPVSHIAKVEGLASSILLDTKHPRSPVNRRIAIIILKKSAVDALQRNAIGTELDDLAKDVNNK